MLFFGDYHDRWIAAPVVRKYTNDPLSWQTFLVSQRAQNPNAITLDFAVGTEYVSGFRRGASNAGYSTSILHRKRIDYEGGRGECTMEASLIEVRFSGLSTSSICLIAAVVSLGILGFVYRESLKATASEYIGSWR
jgi:hypothetical protein